MRGLLSITLLISCVGCIEPFYPSLNSDGVNALVVDGHISLNGTATVILSRSISMTTTGLMPPEKNASVVIESSAGEMFSLKEGETGTYNASGLAVSRNDKFILHITTSQGRSYRSDDVQMYSTPPIDSVYYSVAPSGEEIWIQVNTKDATANSPGYYLWDCIETYQYHAPVYSPFKLVNHVAVARLPEEDVYTCWRDVSVPSVVQSSQRLTQNIISGKVVAVVERYSPKLSIRYSILVRQRAISQAEFDFRSQLISTTEQQGSIFATVPGLVLSNIHSLEDPDEYVLGYFRAQDVTERRFFLSYSELPEHFKAQRPTKGCAPEPTCPLGVPVLGPNNCIDIINLGNQVITSVVTQPDGSPFYYYWVRPDCGDCRSSGGGTTARPPFW